MNENETPDPDEKAQEESVVEAPAAESSAPVSEPAAAEQAESTESADAGEAEEADDEEEEEKSGD